MCRWLAYSGTPILIEELLYRTEHSLIDQSIHVRMGVETTNGDGSHPFRHEQWLWVHTLRVMYPENEVFRLLSDESRIVVSEPLGSLLGARNPVPESSYGIVQKGDDVLGHFVPRRP